MIFAACSLHPSISVFEPTFWSALVSAASYTEVLRAHLLGQCAESTPLLIGFSYSYGPFIYYSIIALSITDFYAPDAYPEWHALPRRHGYRH